jgi:dTDP-4-dehydrorhamnose reductase
MKILLFGSTGMLGKYVFNLLKKEYDVICINRENYDILNDEWFKLKNIITSFLKEKDIIINCAGIIPQKYTDENIKTYIKVNTLFPHKLNEISQKNNINFIHITTDCVYDGLNGNYSSLDTHSAKNIYGISKSLGEPEEATVIRTSIIGEELFGKKSLIEWIKSNKNGTINGFINHYWNGVTCFTLAKIIKQIIHENLFWQGVKNIHSPDTVTKYDLCCYVNNIYNLNIKINKTEDIIKKNMTLLEKNIIFEIDSIYNQLLTQKDMLYDNSTNELNNSLFNCPNKDTYPPFKNGLYLEEYFFKKINEEKPNLSKKYIPVKWTNFQIEKWFQDRKQEMQDLLDEWVLNNPSENGYFTVVQYDDGPLLKLPNNTVIYGACSGDIPLPLIYQDINNTLINIPQKDFNEKNILCSFVGNITANHIQPNVREVMKSYLNNKQHFLFYDSGGWNPIVNINLQNKFIDITSNSKFALAPRGYGRGSFRFFECFKLGTIPIYLWNDNEWLPFKNLIDYKKLCISLHISDIDKLESILLSITEDEYKQMFEYYKEIKHLFELEGMSIQIIKENIN